MQAENDELGNLSSRCADILVWQTTGKLPDDCALRSFAADLPADRVTQLSPEMTAEHITRNQALALVAGMKDLRPLLPPASIDGDYLDGWCEGQSYLMMNYGTDEAEAAMLRDTNLIYELETKVATFLSALRSIQDEGDIKANAIATKALLEAGEQA